MRFAGGASESMAVSYLRLPASRGPRWRRLLGWRRRVVTIPSGKTKFVARGATFLRVVADSLEDSLASPCPFPQIKTGLAGATRATTPFKFLTRNERRFLAHLLGI